MRSRFVTAAYFNPSVLTDASGRASVKFRLPDNLTTFRIMAVAADAVDRFGSGESEIKVNKPFMMRPALPRFLLVGDRFQAGVVVHNHSKAAREAKVEVQVKGMKLLGSSSQSEMLKPGASKEIRFKFLARVRGTATFRFKGQMGDYRDEVMVKKPVKIATVMHAVAVTGRTAKEAREWIGRLKGVRKDVGGLSLRLASTALVGLDAGIDHLIQYPYGCLEQTVSRMVPLVGVGDLASAFGIKLKKDPRAMVVKAIAKISKLQMYSGGFKFWSSSSRPSLFGTAYAVWGLHAAKEHGYKVDPQILNRGSRFLSKGLRMKSKWYSNSTKAYFLYVLSLLKKSEPAYITKLYNLRDELPIFAKSWLLLAIKNTTGDSEMLKELTRQIFNHLRVDARHAHFTEKRSYYQRWYYLFASSVRSTALALKALLAVAPNHTVAPKIVAWLLASRKEGRWRSTQETAHALMALTDYYKIQEKEIPDFRAKAMLGGTKLASARFVGRSTRVVSKRMEMKKLIDEVGSALVFSKTVAGKLYYSVLLKYAPTRLPRKSIDQGFYVKRDYYPFNPDADTKKSKAAKKKRAPLKSVTAVKAGELVRVVLTIISPAARNFVVVDDPLPAGLEAVNATFKTTSLATMRKLGGPSWYSPFNHKELRDDRVLLFADRLEAGVWKFSYLARATTPGDYVTAPLKAEEMYHPEVFGRTGAIRFEVR